jgi:hypothetical protein
VVESRAFLNCYLTVGTGWRRSLVSGNSLSEVLVAEGEEKVDETLVTMTSCSMVNGRNAINAIQIISMPSCKEYLALHVLISMSGIQLHPGVLTLTVAVGMTRLRIPKRLSLRLGIRSSRTRDGPFFH